MAYRSNRVAPALTEHETPRQAFEPGTAQAQKQPQHRSLKLRMDRFCDVSRASAESADETGRRARKRRFSG
eukprot:13547839-Alexandrium_andersonii.AAC.1